MSASGDVVCLHGLGRTSADWDAVRGPLAAHGRVVAPPAEALEIPPRAIVIGHSMGAVLALRLLRDAPRPLRAVPIDFARAAAARHPRAELHELDAGGHDIHVNEPEAWLAVVLPWLG